MVFEIVPLLQEIQAANAQFGYANIVSSGDNCVKFKSNGSWKYYQVQQELQAANARFTALKSHILVFYGLFYIFTSTHSFRL